MKKVALSLAGVLAAVAFAPEASAVPAFARQTGMACNACHFQTYPALNSFGRAFKTSGFTLMGAQTKVEGEHGLSIPSTLNAAVYTQLRYIKTNGGSFVGGVPVTQTNKSNNGRWDFPDEMALFLGGRVSENIGFMAEIGLVGPVTTNNFKMPFMFDVGSVKLGAVPFMSSGIGANYGYDVFATGSTGAGRVTENGIGYSAALYMGASNQAGSATSDATGLALVVANDDFHVNVSPYAGANPMTTATAALVGPGGGAYTIPGGNTATKLGATYVRAAWTPNFNGWDIGVGVQNWSGKPIKGYVPDASGIADVESKLTVVDAQAQGEVAGMPLGIYASYGTAPKSTAATLTGTGANLFNLCGSTAGAVCENRTAFGILGDLWVIPGTLGVQLGFMRGKTGMANATTGALESDNSYTIGARYKLRQNVKMGLAYSKFSGSAYDIGGSGGVNTANGAASGGGVGGAAGVDPRVAGMGDSRMAITLSAGF